MQQIEETKKTLTRKVFLISKTIVYKIGIKFLAKLPSFSRRIETEENYPF